MTQVVTDKKTLRCAIYTRNSHEEGLGQEFNSLDAQREAAELGRDGQTLDIRAPMEFKARSGRKEIILPAEVEDKPKAQTNRPLVVALVRAHRWQRMIDSGEVSGVTEIAAHHGVNRAYVSRILGLAMLAPDLTEAALKGKEPEGLSLAKLGKGLPVCWTKQHRILAAQSDAH